MNIACWPKVIGAQGIKSLLHRVGLCRRADMKSEKLSIFAVVAQETGHRCSRRVRSIVVDEAGVVREQTVRSSSLQCRLLVVL